MENAIIEISSREKDKIVPLTKVVPGDLEKYVASMEKLIMQVFGNELASDASPPFIKWKECDQFPGAFSIYLLAEVTASQAHQEIHPFFQEMISHWLIDDPLYILSSRNLTFKLSDKGDKGEEIYYFAELIVNVTKQHHIFLINSNLPMIAEEIKLGAKTASHAKHILELKRLSLGGKASYIYESFVHLMNRFPKIFKSDIFREIQYFFVHLREEFCAIRSVKHLTRLIATHYIFLKDLDQAFKIAPQKRHLYFRFLKTHLSYPLGLKKVLGLSIALNSLNEYEHFEQAHILKAVQRIFPDVKTISDSFYYRRNKESKFLTLYIELERPGGFGLSDLKRLRRFLPQELKNSIEYLSPSLFVPRNEEELYKNIVTLSQELKFIRDLPQAIISFKDHRGDFLKFDVILLRLLHENSLSMLKESEKLPPHVRFVPEKVAQVGIVRKKYPKEANVFSLEIESRQFLRKNHSVDLVRARQHVAKLLEKLVGNFRDYNGGFLFKQNEQCEAIKKELGDSGKNEEFLVENLFYSLNPSIMQTLIPPHHGRELVHLFLQTINVELPSKMHYLLEKKIDKEKLLLVIKFDNMEIKEALISMLKEIKTGALKLASSFLEVDGRHYGCFLYLNPLPDEMVLFLNSIEKRLQDWQKRHKNLQRIRILLPHAPQSLDPRLGADRTSGVIIKMLFEGLMRLNKKAELEMGMAEKVEVSSDGKRYTFTLRNALWSNGMEVTSYDFESAWKKILDPQFRSIYAFLFFAIKNAELCKKGKLSKDHLGIHAPDKKTLIIDLEHPFANFLSLTAHWTHAPLCHEFDKSHPGWSYHRSETHVSNGPFKLDAWKFNGDLQVVKNPFYWDAPSVKLDKIEVRVVEDDLKMFEMFHRGELDWLGDPITRISPNILKKLKGDPVLCQNDLKGFFLLHLNLERLPFKSLKIRQALSLAIDREYLVNQVLHCDDEPAYNFYSQSNKKGSFDREKAKLLFEEGLLEQSLTRKTLPQIIFSHSDIVDHETITLEIGRQWEESFGIKVKYEKLPWKIFSDMLSKNSLLVGGVTWHSRYNDPLYQLDLLNQKDLVAEWQNKHFQELMQKAKLEKDHKKREAFILEADHIVMSEMPVIPIVYQKWRFLKNPRLKNVILSANGQMDFREAYLENEENL